MICGPIYLHDASVLTGHPEPVLANTVAAQVIIKEAADYSRRTHIPALGSCRRRNKCHTAEHVKRQHNSAVLDRLHQQPAAHGRGPSTSEPEVEGLRLIGDTQPG